MTGSPSARSRPFRCLPPLSTRLLVGVAGLLGGGIDDILLFFYGRDWTRGERIWTPKEARAAAARERYRSASEVSCAPLDALRSTLLGKTSAC